MRQFSPIVFTVLTAGAVFQGGLFFRMELAWGQEGSAEPALEGEVGPAELLKSGRRAFERNDFAAAEKAFDRFVRDYGENPEAEEALQAHRPFLALAKVGVGKYGEALTLIRESLNQRGLEAKLEDELRFWLGICLMQANEYVAAQEAFGKYWTNEKHEPFKRYEALLLFAGLYLMQDFDQFAADFLKDQIPKMRGLAPEAAGRAVVLRLHALLESAEDEQALDLLKEEFPRMDELTQMISFQLQALELGARFLEAKEYRKAIFCLQRVWPKQKLLHHQRGRLEELRKREEKLAEQGNRQAVLFQIKAIIRRVQRELEQLEKLENFDSGLRLRVAIAFQGQKRYREAALVIQEMLGKMPPDAVVDSASMALIQCWMQIGRWPKAVEAADLYVERFTAWKGAGHLAEAMFLKGEALREANQAQQAALAYGQVVEQFPDDNQAPAALFLQGYMYLVQDDAEGAVYHFDQLRKRYPRDPLVEEADYWMGMAHFFASDYAKAREQMQAYLKKYGEGGATGKYRVDGEFRSAYCVFALGDGPGAITLFQRFIDGHSEHPLVDEARLLLGDAYLGEGRIDEGIASYRRITPRAERFFEDGWFKMGKALRLTGKLAELRSHFEQFLERHPDSRRMPEAVYWLGWVDRQNGEMEKAKQVYWEVVEKSGNEPDYFAVEDLFAAMPKLYREAGGQGDQDLLSRLEAMLEQAEASGARLMALRCGWGKAQVYRGRDEKAYRVALLEASPKLDAKHDNPRIAVDCADAQREMGNYTVAWDLYEAVRKWHPRAVEKGRVYAGMGRIAEQRGELGQAIEYYEKCERTTASPELLGETQLRRARLLAETKKAGEAQLALNEILESKGGSSHLKARALFEAGELLMGAGEPRKAAAYYERIYVAYGKYRELVARAYWRRGQALEKLSLGEEALEVYGELAGRDDLQGFDEAKMALKKVESLKGGEGGSS